MRKLDVMGALLLTFTLGPILLAFVAFVLDFASWALTGREIFPWIGHSMSYQDGK